MADSVLVVDVDWKAGCDLKAYLVPTEGFCPGGGSGPSGDFVFERRSGVPMAVLIREASLASLHRTDP